MVFCSLSGQSAPRRDWHLNVNFSVPEVAYIQIYGTALDFKVQFRGFAHGSLFRINDIQMRYVIASNGSDKKLTAQLSENMPMGVQLELRITEPNGAIAPAGGDFVEITSNPIDVLNYISNAKLDERVMDFRLKVDDTAIPATNVNRTITFTLKEQQ